LVVFEGCFRGTGDLIRVIRVIRLPESVRSRGVLARGRTRQRVSHTQGQVLSHLPAIGFATRAPGHTARWFRAQARVVQGTKTPFASR
jgi:hypothetical protein